MAVSELADFVNASRERQIDDRRAVAEAAYVAGCIGAMSLQKSRPKFDDIFTFPKREEKVQQVDKSKAQMLAYAAYLDREAARMTKERGDGHDG